MAYMVNRDAPYSGLANLMAMNGRFGDTELVHMSKPEIRGLASLGELTINPDTGLPEAFSLGSILPLAVNVGLGFATGGMSLPAQMAVMGAGNFIMGKAQGLSTGDAFFNSVLGAVGTGLMRGITGAAGAGAASGASGVVTDPAMGTGFADAAGNFVHTATPEAALLGGGYVPSFSGADAMGLDLGGSGYTGVADTFEPLSTMGGDASITTSSTPSFGSKISNWIGDNPLEATGVGGLGLAGLAALSGEEEEVDVSEEKIQPLPRSEFTGHKTRGPFTEQQLLDLALRGGDALDDDDIDEDGQLAFDFFTPSRYTRKNDGGLVGIPQTKQRSNVTNFMLAQDKGMPSSLDVFEIGKVIGNLGKEQPNAGIMQLAVGGQPKSNIAQMLNPTLEGQAPTPSLNYDELRRRAYLQGENSPFNIYQTQHEDILRDTLGKIVEDSKKEVIETPEEPVAPVAPIPKPVDDSTYADGDPDQGDVGGPDAEASSEEEEGTSADPADYARGGIVGLAKGGRLDPFSKELLRQRMLQRESSGNYSARNQLDYVGGYQFGAAALEDLGYIKKGRSAKFKNAAVLNSKNWTGKDGIKDLNSFYKDKNLQDKLFDEYAEINYKKLKRKGVFKKDSSPEHVAGMLAASHLLGAGNASKDLSIKDGNKVPGNVYYELGRKAIKPALNLGSTKGEHRRIASQKRNEQKSMPEPKKVRTVPKEASQDSSMLEGLTNIFTGKTINIPKGGSLSKLAEQYGTGVPELLRINEDITDPNVVDAGQRVKVSRGILDYLSNIVPLSEGGTIDQYFEGQVVGRGDGMSDQIMFEVQGKKPDKALLSKDEYVLPADMVSILGNGSSNAGAEVLDQFVKDTRQKGFGTQRQQRQINPQKGLSALV